jgi:hypothetical protein
MRMKLESLERDSALAIFILHYAKNRFFSSLYVKLFAYVPYWLNMRSGDLRINVFYVIII